MRYLAKETVRNDIAVIVNFFVAGKVTYRLPIKALVQRRCFFLCFHNSCADENYILVMQTVKCPSQPTEEPDGDVPADGDDETTANRTLAIAFSWAHGGNDVYLCGSFSKWRRIPMTKRLCVNVTKCYLM